MTPIIRYAFMKSARERFLWPLLLAPAIFLGAPMLGISIDAARQGRRAFPMRLPTLTFPQTNVAILGLTVMLVATTSAAAAFWVFRSDIANRSLSFFLISVPHSTLVSTAATIFGGCIGVVSLVPMVPIIAITSGAFPAGTVRAVVVAVISSFVAAAIGALISSASPTPGNLFLATMLGAMVGIIAFNLGAAATTAAAITISAMSIYGTGRFMERRCAS